MFFSKQKEEAQTQELLYTSYICSGHTTDTSLANTNHMAKAIIDGIGKYIGLIEREEERKGGREGEKEGGREGRKYLLTKQNKTKKHHLPKLSLIFISFFSFPMRSHQTQRFHFYLFLDNPPIYILKSEFLVLEYYD